MYYIHKGVIKLKKLLFLTISVFVASALIYKVYAANGQGTGSQDSAGQGTQGSTTQPIQNQNQVQTQNQGEDQQLQVQTQEQQGIEPGKGVNSNSDNAGVQLGKRDLTQVRSSVAQQVQALLSTQSAAGGIGDQVKQWAKTQQQSELKIQEHLTKIESKTGLARSLFGPNYGSLNDLKQEVEQNRVRVQQLEQLGLKLTNQVDIINVQAMIELLNQENIALQEKINLEEANGGVLGWLVKLFAK